MKGDISGAGEALETLWWSFGFRSVYTNQVNCHPVPHFPRLFLTILIFFFPEHWVKFSSVTKVMSSGFLHVLPLFFISGKGPVSPMSSRPSITDHVCESSEKMMSSPAQELSLNLTEAHLPLLERMPRAGPLASSRSLSALRTPEVGSILFLLHVLGHEGAERLNDLLKVTHLRSGTQI